MTTSFRLHENHCGYIVLAYGCVIFAPGLSFATVLGIMLHCQPFKYNWTLPVNDYKHCFDLTPFVVAVGITLDALIWTIPHFVV
jgi:hypothetical protein